MKYNLLTPLLLLLTCYICSCSDHKQQAVFDRAESLMEAHPDSALTLLRAIDGSRLHGEQRARHALLLSQAYDKNFIDITDDSLISIAVAYYSRPSASDHYRIAAHYYKANVAYFAKDYPSAIYHATLADTLASIADNLHYRGMANNLISLSYGNVNDYKRELEFANKAYNFFKENADSARAALSLMNVGRSYLDLQDYDTALAILTSPECKPSAKSIAESLIRQNRISDYSALVKEHPELALSPKLNSLHALSLLRENRVSEADSLIKIARDQSVSFYDSSYYLVAEAELLYVKEDWKKFAEIALFANNRAINKLNKTFAEYDSHGQLQARDYISALSAEQSARKRQLLIITIVSLIIAFLIFLILWLNRRRILARRLLEKECIINDLLSKNTLASDRIRTLNDSISRLRAELDDAREKALSSTASRLPDITEEEMDRLTVFVNERTRFLHDLFRQLQHTASTENNKSEQIKKAIDTILSPETLRFFEKYVDATSGGLLTRARKAGFSEKEILLISFNQLEFTNSEIAQLVQSTYSSVSSKKSRIFGRLANHGLIERKKR